MYMCVISTVNGNKCEILPDEALSTDVSSLWRKGKVMLTVRAEKLRLSSDRNVAVFDDLGQRNGPYSRLIAHDQQQSGKLRQYPVSARIERYLLAMSIISVFA